MDPNATTHCLKHACRVYSDRYDNPELQEKEKRSPYQRDLDRVLASPAFRRLAGVTQVSAVREKQLLHNRLTHSLKVGELGRRIAENLYNQGFRGDLGDCCSRELPNIVEVAGLVHDIGHPPFGHVAEKSLSNLMSTYELGFEGNAQSFRVVTKLATRNKDEDKPGLNLTQASLNAILKYPRFRGSSPNRSAPWWDRRYGAKWGAYESERVQFEHARREFPDRSARSDASLIMDWADDISYATHDIYDYFRAGLLPLQDLTADQEEFIAFSKQRIKYKDFNWQEFRSAYEWLLDLANKGSAGIPTRRYTDRREDRVALYEFVTERLDEFIGDAVKITGGGIEIEKTHQYRVEVLKQLTWFYVIYNPALAVAQEGQMRIIEQLFSLLLTLLADYEPTSGPGQRTRVPTLLREFYRHIVEHEMEWGTSLSDVQRRACAVCDYICLLTEDQAVDLYERLTGTAVSRSSIFGAWFH
jgi:dGTPase